MLESVGSFYRGTIAAGRSGWVMLQESIQKRAEFSAPAAAERLVMNTVYTLIEIYRPCGRVLF
jgi:hypothetical protein